MNNLFNSIDKDFLEYYKDKCELTEEEFSIILMRRKKLFIYQIAQRTNLSEGTVKNRLKGINQKVQDKLQRLVYQYKSEGLSNFEIGHKVGINAQTVAKIINDIINCK